MKVSTEIRNSSVRKVILSHFSGIMQNKSLGHDIRRITSISI